MNVERLKSNYPALIEYMQSHNYHTVTISRFRAEIKRIIKYACIPEVTSYEDYFEKMYGEGRFAIPKWKSRAKHQLIKQIKLFVEEGIFPDNSYHHTKTEASPYFRICLEFKSIVDYAISKMVSRGLKQTTLDTQRNLLSRFFIDVEEKYGVNRLSSIDSSIIYKYFTYNDTQRLCSSVILRIKRSLSDCIGHPLGQECERINRLIPVPQRVRRIYPEMSEDNKRKVEALLLDESSDISKRDRAIMLLIYYTGLRSCDVANLKLTDIDWKLKVLKIKQLKTGAEWSIKLEAVLGNAIFDYIKEERHRVNIPNIFLAHDHHYRSVRPATIGAICTRTMQKAGIDIKTCRCGAHVFRHKVATDMLATGINIPTISAVLGHMQPISVNTYLSVSEKKLKECSLSIVNFPYNSI